MKPVRVTVPASAANLGPGFEALGLAVSLRNEVVLQAAGRMQTSGDGITCVTVEGNGARKLPTGRTNLVVKAARCIFTKAKCTPERLRIRLKNKIPLASGLGSSAAAVVAGMLAANEICKRPFTLEQILQLAVKMEGHPDNVTAALYGGLTLSVVGEKGKVHVHQPRVRKDLTCIFCVPERPVPTATARKALPSTYKKSDVVYSLSRAAMLTALLQGGSTDLFRIAMDDRLHQPQRAKLMPGSMEAVRAATKAGALGACLSGAGPTVLAFDSRPGNPDRIATAMVEALAKARLPAQALVLNISRNGAHVGGG